VPGVETEPQKTSTIRKNEAPDGLTFPVDGNPDRDQGCSQQDLKMIQAIMRDGEGVFTRGIDENSEIASNRCPYEGTIGRVPRSRVDQNHMTIEPRETKSEILGGLNQRPRRLFARSVETSHRSTRWQNNMCMKAGRDIHHPWTKSPLEKPGIYPQITSPPRNLHSTPSAQFENK
jgi:hypothetical protein